ncbi:MAG: SUMF1/EgtB/PvdO family nonheme iron enzyme [Deltaproteobacteria bacterium]|nr:SUMF1/EgtB/PvdO family nonheme iron enzyme [Deltaproteobacteria bacterium]
MVNLKIKISSIKRLANIIVEQYLYPLVIKCRYLFKEYDITGMRHIAVLKKSFYASLNAINNRKVGKSRFSSTVLSLICFLISLFPSAVIGEVAQSLDSDLSAQHSNSISRQIRQAGELALTGDTVRATEILRQALKECQSNDGESHDCANWLRALQGLNMMLENPKKLIDSTNSIGMRLVRIPSGEYMMGSPKQELDWLRLTFRRTWREGHKQWFQDETPLHPVRITKPFYMGAYDVTVKEFRDFVDDTKYKTDAEKGDGGMIFSNKDNRWVPQKNMKWDSVPWKIADNQPVVFVSWNDAQAFCKWLSRKEKRRYRLPTEAEWEMACRGGAVWVRYPWGNKLPGDRDTNFGDGNPKLPASLTTVNDGYEYVSPVGSYPPNGFGLYDMDGNVMEWVQDYYDRNYYETSPINDPQGPATGSGRVNKGGNWFASPADCRCAFRGFSGETMSFWNLGFRVVMEDNSPSDILKTANSTLDKTSQSYEPSSSSGMPPSEEDGVRLFRQAMFAAQQQQWDNAVEDLEKALKLYQEREDPKWIARVKATLAGIYAERNRTFKSKELYTQALSEFRKMGDTVNAKIILARLQELETSPGVKVVEVQKGSIADRIGIVPGDVLVEYAGETGLRVSSLKKLVEEYTRTPQITLSVMNNNELTTTVVPGGPLGVALEDIKRPPRPARAPEQQQNQRERRNPRDRRNRR